MGKKYLDTKENSLESSILGVWEGAAEQTLERAKANLDARTKEYKVHQEKLAAARIRRENKKVTKEEVDIDEAVKHMEVPPDGPRGRGVPMAHPERIGYDSKENQQAYNSITHGTPDNQIDTAKHFMKKGLKGKQLHKAVADHHDVIHADVHKQLNHDKKKLHPLHMSFVEEVDLDEDILPQLFMGTIAAGLLPVIFMSMREIIRGTPLESSIKKIVDKLKKNKNYKMSDSEKSDVKGFVSKVKKDKPSLLQKVMKKFKEEVDLDEKVKEYKGVAYFKTRKDAEEHMKKFASKGRVVEYERGYAVQTRTSGPYLNKAGKTEEFELDENRMSQLHQMIKDKKSAEEIAKEMKLDVKTVKALMNSHHPEDVEESAASDARRAMRRDKDFSRKDSADDDTNATDDDIKGASKNIMMQMRKAQSLNGRFDVEFADKKKVKIPAKMAIAVQQKYNAMRKPADKEKFQARIGKSYKDMLSALKEELQPKKESILERMNRKIKENKDG